MTQYLNLIGPDFWYFP